MDSTSEYDSMYLAGVVLFNQQDYFEAHEVWEDLWAERMGLEHQFLQGLIQVAVGLCHFINGNLRGAKKLYESSRAYLKNCPSPFWGMDLDAFYKQHHRCHEKLLQNPDTTVEIDEDLLPMIALHPLPEQWPDVSEYLEEEDDSGGG